MRVLSFTGSTEVGRLLYRQSAETVKRLVLELGGHAPFIVFADADLDRAVEEAIKAKFVDLGPGLPRRQPLLHRAAGL